MNLIKQLHLYRPGTWPVSFLFLLHYE